MFHNRMANRQGKDPQAQLESYRETLQNKLNSLYKSLRQQESKMFGEDVNEGMDTESNPRITYTEFLYQDSVKVNALIDTVKALYSDIRAVKAGEKSAATLEYPSIDEVVTMMNNVKEIMREIHAERIFHNIRQLYRAGISEAANLKPSQVRPPL